MMRESSFFYLHFQPLLIFLFFSFLFYLNLLPNQKVSQSKVVSQNRLVFYVSQKSQVGHSAIHPASHLTLII